LNHDCVMGLRADGAHQVSAQKMGANLGVG